MNSKARLALQKAREEGRTGRQSFACPYCMSLADRRPYRPHLLSCARRYGYALPSMPPTPPVYSSGMKGTDRTIEQERKYRAGLSRAAKYRYFRTVFVLTTGIKWEDALDAAEQILREEGHA